ncbi:uncharacterized protein BJX67DRAFT_287305 [Aspergillus lucknowensis]|uniref:Uncharacterized protein n=1 Tax=Aspergillus lucknowensis TaxID=176173 RepID=A0ABR4M1C3_9EURO
MGLGRMRAPSNNVCNRPPVCWMAKMRTWHWDTAIAHQLAGRSGFVEEILLSIDLLLLTWLYYGDRPGCSNIHIQPIWRQCSESKASESIDLMTEFAHERAVYWIRTPQGPELKHGLQRFLCSVSQSVFLAASPTMASRPIGLRKGTARMSVISGRNCVLRLRWQRNTSPMQPQSTDVVETRREPKPSKQQSIE